MVVVMTMTMMIVIMMTMTVIPSDVRSCPSTAAWPGLWWGHYWRQDLVLLLLL